MSIEFNGRDQKLHNLESLDEGGTAGKDKLCLFYGSTCKGFLCCFGELVGFLQCNRHFVVNEQCQ